MNSYYIETYIEGYDYAYQVNALTSEEALDKLKNHWDDTEEDAHTIHKVNGPFRVKDVVCVKEPNY